MKLMLEIFRIRLSLVLEGI